MKEKPFGQLPRDQWPIGLSLPIATLSLEPFELEERCGVVFFEDIDDLDFFKAAIIVTGGGETYALVRYRGCPSPGTEVWVGQTHLGTSSDIQPLLNALRLTGDVVRWRHPNLSF